MACGFRMCLNRLPRVTTKNHAFQPGRQTPADPIGIPGTIPMTSILQSTLAEESGEVAIASCTRTIDSGRYGGRQLARLLANRCAEWPERENDRAIEDCSQAIQINPNDADLSNNRPIDPKLDASARYVRFSVGPTSHMDAT